MPTIMPPMISAIIIVRPLSYICVVSFDACRARASFDLVSAVSVSSRTFALLRTLARASVSTASLSDSDCARISVTACCIS